MFARAALSILHRKHARSTGRIVVVTGARQVGKSTLVRHAFPDYAYIALDDPTSSGEWARLPSAAWAARYPRAILDEVQKVPSLLHTIKGAYDAANDARYILLGSSQIHLLTSVSETLAGRAAMLDLWPLTLPELETATWESPVATSRLVDFLRGDRSAFDVHAVPAAHAAFARAAATLERYLARGGMPAVHAPDLDDEGVRDWLTAYRRTYLERDVADLATLRDLEPFARCQVAIAERTAGLINLADLARTAGVSPATAQRFLRYLEVSFQVVTLNAWWRNTEKRLAKAPKVHFVDPGVHRAVVRRWGEPTGEAFESAVVGEILKQVRTVGLDAELFHLRTHDGREVDLLLALPDGYVAIEVKLARTTAPTDARHLRGLGALLDRPLLGSFVLHRGHEVRDLGDGIMGLPVAWALGARVGDGGAPSVHGG